MSGWSVHLTTLFFFFLGGGGGGGVVNHYFMHILSLVIDNNPS